ncbi:hypothetical protein J2Z42_001505 [Clostridium algifaecis]|uniref:Uncharacterized protein n=1 Tax=Clostridium algifaecis TaxID=1472040 RepID=A0ABS4KTR8_9CLOT|nr:hypothetical protein [Clostridium algifaecis]MBP2032831.1 hypothetical protein [Clostridium algifaecis]
MNKKAVLCNEHGTSCENTYKIMWDRYIGAWRKIQMFNKDKIKIGIVI